MKRVLALLLVFAMLLTGCGKAPSGPEPTATPKATPEVKEQASEQVVSPTPETIDLHYLEDNPGKIIEGDSKSAPKEPKFSRLNDPELLNYVEQNVFAEVAAQLGPDYRVDNVSATYISKEYIEELEYNSQANVFFGYTLAELDKQFQGTPYVFTLDEEHHETTVIPLEKYDDTYERVLKNVAIGTGVILVCVTVSAVSGGLGAPAVSMIFAASAKTGTIFALSSGAMGTTIAGITKYVETGDLDESLKAGALAGSESFKWGAISGAVIGGGTELVTLKTAARGGLSLNEVATILKENDLPANFLKQIHSMDEYYELVALADQGGLAIQDIANICMNTGYPLEVVKMFHSVGESTVYFEQAGLYAETINGEMFLVRSIDLSYQSELAGQTVTNLERMKLGYAAIDPITGQSFQLHHIGQTVDSPLAILTPFEHTGGGNNAILHNVNIEAGHGVHSLISDAEWTAQKIEFWQSFAEFLVAA